MEVRPMEMLPMIDRQSDRTIIDRPASNAVWDGPATVACIAGEFAQ